MAIVLMGRFLSLVALGVTGWSAAIPRYRSASTAWRFLTAIGEVLYFWTPWAKIGGVLFVAGAVMTVYQIFHESSRPDEVSRGRKDAIELIELIAWLWMVNALR